MISGASRDQLVSKENIQKVQDARKTGDMETLGSVFSELWKKVASQAAGFEMPKQDKEAFGKKIGQLYHADDDSDEYVKNYLAQYQRDLALPAMNQAIQMGAGQGLVKEVVRQAEGESTCPWCLERCGIWDPYDANNYGVWARHGSCDCDIYIRWVQDDNNSSQNA